MFGSWCPLAGARRQWDDGLSGSGPAEGLARSVACVDAMDGMGDQGNGLMRENAAPATGGAAGLTAKVLASRAAAAALSGPAVAAGQWVYRRCAVVASPDNAASPVVAEGWA